MIEHIEQGTLPSKIKACIALTSWKKRINTVGLTIYNLFETCGPDYHIVLTLAEEEFPRKEQELPRDLLLMNKAGVFEILWVKKNWRSFKKWIFCGLKYRNVPIISADDDCIYKCNYADKLFNFWKTHKRAIITNDGMNYSHGKIQWGRGPNTLYPPAFISELLSIATLPAVQFLTELHFMEDDALYGCLAKHLKMQIIDLGEPSFYIFHSQIEPLSAISANTNFEKITQIYETIIGMLK